jgi:hypothetical protein
VQPVEIGGESRIRTCDALSSMAVFKTVGIIRSPISPRRKFGISCAYVNLWNILRIVQESERDDSSAIHREREWASARRRDKAQSITGSPVQENVDTNLNQTP